MDDVIFIYMYVNFSAAEILEKYGVNMTITAIRDSQVFIWLHLPQLSENSMNILWCSMSISHAWQGQEFYLMYFEK